MQGHRCAYHDDPPNRAPRACEEENVEAHEGDEHFVRHLRIGSHSNNSHDELAQAHPNGTKEQNRTTTPFLNEIQAREGRKNIDEVGREADKERVTNARVLEELRSIVKDEVNASQLRSGHDHASCEKTFALRSGFLDDAHPVGLAD
jgi:hypothetical protein